VKSKRGSGCQLESGISLNLDRKRFVVTVAKGKQLSPRERKGAEKLDLRTEKLNSKCMHGIGRDHHGWPIPMSTFQGGQSAMTTLRKLEKEPSAMTTFLYRLWVRVRRAYAEQVFGHVPLRLLRGGRLGPGGETLACAWRFRKDAAMVE
jgi:hypothetical protein